MSTVTTTRPVNLYQLAQEIGKPRILVDGPRLDGTTVVEVPGVGVAALTAALLAHDADPTIAAPVEPDAEPAISDARMAQILQLASGLIDQAGDLWDALEATSHTNTARPFLSLVTDTVLTAALPLVDP